MIKTFDKIKEKKSIEFAMPLSLRIKKECFENNINYQSMHIIDVFSLIYSIRIENAKKYIEAKRQERMNKAGVASIKAASEEDFDNL